MYLGEEIFSMVPTDIIESIEATSTLDELFTIINKFSSIILIDCTTSPNGKEFVVANTLFSTTPSLETNEIEPFPELKFPSFVTKYPSLYIPLVSGEFVSLVHDVIIKDIIIKDKILLIVFSFF